MVNPVNPPNPGTIIRPRASWFQRWHIREARDGLAPGDVAIVTEPPLLPPYVFDFDCVGKFIVNTDREWGFYMEDIDVIG